MEKINKPIKAKPIFYAVCYEPLKKIAQEHGYNLLISGSLNRDMDLVSIAWVDNPTNHITLLELFCECLGVNPLESGSDYHFSILSGGRSSYVINLNRGGRWNKYTDEQWYLDISFTPQINTINE